MKKSIWLLACLCFVVKLAAQTVTEQEIIEQALKNYHSVRIADLEVRQRKALERTAFNPQQPALTLETPSDFGLAFEVDQQFSLPGQYIKRSRWLKNQTSLAGQNALLTRRELTRMVSLSYLEAQETQAILTLRERQDSLWQRIAVTSRSLFDNGQINAADLLFAETKAGQVANELLQAHTAAHNNLIALAVFTNGKAIQITALQALILVNKDTTGAFYFENYQVQREQTLQSELALRQAERLPNITIGFLRSPERDTDFRYRLKAGLTIPLWQGQYRGELDAVSLAIESVQTEVVLQRQQGQATRSKLLQTLAQTRQSLDYFEKTGLRQAEELTVVSRRLYQGGEYDYIQFLRNTSDAFELQNLYIETLKKHNEAVIELRFLASGF